MKYQTEDVAQRPRKVYASPTLVKRGKLARLTGDTTSGIVTDFSQR